MTIEIFAFFAAVASTICAMIFLAMFAHAILWAIVLRPLEGWREYFGWTVLTAFAGFLTFAATFGAHHFWGVALRLGMS